MPNWPVLTPSANIEPEETELTRVTDSVEPVKLTPAR
jgi:ATP-dependent Clp protease protease subunit